MTETYIQQIDLLHLQEIVARLLGSENVRLKNWEIQPIRGGLEQHSAVIRCMGQADQGDKTLPWSVVLKIVSRDKHNDPNGWRFWKREVLAYQSGFLGRIPANLVAPRCIAVEEKSEDLVWIWMEDVQDDLQGEWTLESYRQSAYQIGRFNGAYLTGTALPEEAWLSHEWLRGYVENAAPMITFIRENPDRPLVKSLYGKNLAIILAFWEIRNSLLDSLEKTPRVFSHQDAFKRNLFFQGGKLLAIDWSYCGITPPASDLVPLVAVSLGFSSIPGDKIFELDRICFDAYMEGLRAAGAQLSTRTVRRCFVLVLLLRYLIAGNIGEVLPALLDEKRHDWLETGFDQPIEKVSKTEDNMERYYLSVFTEALKLMGFVPLIKILYYSVVFSLRKKPFIR